MRLRATVLSLLLVLGLVAGACSSDDDGDEAVDASEQPDDTAVDEDDDDEGSDLEQIVERAQLELSDFGEEGWELVSDEPDDDADDDEPSPLDDCIEGDLVDRFEEAQVAESNQRTFQRAGTGPIPAEVQSSSVAVDDESLFAEMHEAFRDGSFGTCIGEALQRALGERAGEAVVGEVEQADLVVDPGEDEDLQSTGITIPVSVSAEGQTFEMRITIVLLNSGPVGSSLVTTAPEGEISPEHVAEWGRFLAERIAG